MFRFLLALFLGFLLALGAWRFINHVSAGDACISCHSMKFAYEEYQKSGHYKSPSGVRAGCVHCHIPGGLGRLLIFKQLIKDRYVEMTNPIVTIGDWERRRPELARRVRHRLIYYKSDTCVGCHEEGAMVPLKDRGKRAHEEMKKTGETCIDCHYNTVHAKIPWEEKSKAKKLEEGMIDL
jgi:nitrate/TMAO reductase-like tetraheme cytochrome c subunit